MQKLFACCGRKQQIQTTNLRSQAIRPIKFDLNEENAIAHFTLELKEREDEEERQAEETLRRPRKFEWDLFREKTGEEREKELERQRELEKLKKEREAKIKREEEEIAQIQSEIDKLQIAIKEKNSVLDQYSDLYQKQKKEYLITQIKNELIKKMIKEDQEKLKELTNYEFNKF